MTPSGTTPYDARPRIRSVTEQVADALRRRIQERDMQPGDLLGRVADLAAEFGVSRPTMRESIRLVSSGGLLSAVKGSGGGIFVSRTPTDTLMHALADGISTMLNVNATSLDDVMATRIAVEIPVVRLATQRATPEGIAELGAIMAEIEGETPDAEQKMASAARLHVAIARMAQNPLLRATVGWTYEVLETHQRDAPAAAFDQLLMDQHRPIVDAIALHDAATAEDAMRTHLDHLRQRLHEQERPPGSGRAAIP